MVQNFLWHISYVCIDTKSQLESWENLIWRKLQLETLLLRPSCRRERHPVVLISTHWSAPVLHRRCHRTALTMRKLRQVQATLPSGGSLERSTSGIWCWLSSAREIWRGLPEPSSELAQLYSTREVGNCTRVECVWLVGVILVFDSHGTQVVGLTWAAS